MSAALSFVGGCLLVGLLYLWREWSGARARKRDEATAVRIEAEHARRDVAIDLDKTPKPRTEKEIRDDLKDRHPPTHRVIR